MNYLVCSNEQQNLNFCNIIVRLSFISSFVIFFLWKGRLKSTLSILCKSRTQRRDTLSWPADLISAKIKITKNLLPCGGIFGEPPLNLLNFIIKAIMHMQSISVTLFHYHLTLIVNKVARRPYDEQSEYFISKSCWMRFLCKGETILLSIK